MNIISRRISNWKLRIFILVLYWSLYYCYPSKSSHTITKIWQSKYDFHCYQQRLVPLFDTLDDGEQQLAIPSIKEVRGKNIILSN